MGSLPPPLFCLIKRSPIILALVAISVGLAGALLGHCGAYLIGHIFCRAGIRIFSQIDNQQRTPLFQGIPQFKVRGNLFGKTPVIFECEGINQISSVRLN